MSFTSKIFYLVTILSFMIAFQSCGGSHSGSGDNSSPSPKVITKCIEITPDIEYECPGSELISAKHTVTYIDYSVDNVMASDASVPNQSGDIIIDTAQLHTQFSWSTGIATVSPNLQYIISARTKDNCSSLSCSFGRISLWVDKWNPKTRSWTLKNLAPVYGLNSEAHGWSTWLHGKSALFNILVWPTSTGWFTDQSENITQIYKLTIDSNNNYNVSEFAPAKLHDSNCLTGRITAMPNLTSESCFDGQRISFVRRCYQGEAVTAYWNNTQYNGGGSACIPNNPSNAQVSVLRTYVTELDASCTPKKSWASGGILPAHEPSTANIYKQMGRTPEWGEMLSAISPDGKYLAVSTLMGPPANSNSCAGFSYGLQNVNDQNSGGNIRILHWCPLLKNNSNGQITCSNSMTAVNPGLHNPPEGTMIPSFLSMNGVMTVLFSTYWVQYQQETFKNIMQNNLGGPSLLLTFGTDGSNLQGVQAIYH